MSSSWSHEASSSKLRRVWERHCSRTCRVWRTRSAKWSRTWTHRSKALRWDDAHGAWGVVLIEFKLLTPSVSPSLLWSNAWLDAQVTLAAWQEFESQQEAALKFVNKARSTMDRDLNFSSPESLAVELDQARVSSRVRHHVVTCRHVVNIIGSQDHFYFFLNRCCWSSVKQRFRIWTLYWREPQKSSSGQRTRRCFCNKLDRWVSKWTRWRLD